MVLRQVFGLAVTGIGCLFLAVPRPLCSNDLIFEDDGHSRPGSMGLASMRTNDEAGTIGQVREGLAALDAGGGATEEDDTLPRVTIAVARGSRSSVFSAPSHSSCFQAMSKDIRHVFGNAAGFTHNRCALIEKSQNILVRMLLCNRVPHLASV
jgi:hypothetical protein